MYQLGDDRRLELRAAVLNAFRARTAGAEAEIASQRAWIVAVRHKRQKAKEAYYQDAMDIAEFKDEEQRHICELAAAEAIVQRHLTSLTSIEQAVDDLLHLLTDPAAVYETAIDRIKRMLQEVFERLWIIDDQVGGAGLTRPFAELLTVEAQLVARNALTGTDESAVTYKRASG
jgi:hypothetical protein